jgi:hypothetical protein
MPDSILTHFVVVGISYNFSNKNVLQAAWVGSKEMFGGRGEGHDSVVRQVAAAKIADRSRQLWHHCLRRT